MPHPTYFGAIEAGGTKINCAFGLNHEAILAEKRLETKHPDQSLQEVEAFFDECVSKFGQMQAMGVACFGPVDLDRDSKTFGSVIKTPKPYWSNTPVAPRLQARYQVPVGFDLDVNGSALGESLFGAGQGLHTICYVTVGTGIGVGVIANGQSLCGQLHPEFGHIPLHLIPGEPIGVCQYHQSCAAGLASGPAIEQRWGKPAEEFPPGHKMWASQAHYLSALCAAITLAYSPQRIIIGGGVMQHAPLLEQVREQFANQINGFVPVIERSGGVEQYIVSPALDCYSGIAGAFAIAARTEHALS